MAKAKEVKVKEVKSTVRCHVCNKDVDVKDMVSTVECKKCVQ